MAVIGIDIGNLNCVIAQAQRGGVDVILNDASLRQTPTYVSIQGQQRFMGDAAMNLTRSNARQTFFNLKRLIGRKFDEPEVQEELRRLAIDAVRLPNGNVGARVIYDDKEVVLSMEQILAMQLLKLQQIVQAANDGVPVADCVLSVPTWYTDAQRRAMLDAAEISGLNVLTLLNESTAVALSYGIYKSAKQLFDKERPTHVMFVDIGHSSYTVSVVSFIIGQLTVRSAVSDRNLGGRNFDDAIVQYLAEQFKERHGVDVRSNFKSMLKLQAAAEKVKKTLSPVGVKEAVAHVECLHEDIDFSCVITLEKFQEITAHLIARLEGPIQQALAEAGLTPADMEHVEIIGGGTRVEAVKRTLSALLNLDASKTNFGLSTTLNADEASARGCALQCAILSSRFIVKPFNIQDAVSFPIKVSWEQGDSAAMDIPGEEDDEEGQVKTSGNSVIIFKRNDPSPKVRRVTFQKTETFEVTVQYDESGAHMLPPGTDLDLARFRINLPENVASSSRVRFNLRHSRSGVAELASAQLMEEIENKEGEGKEGEAKEGEGKTENGEASKKRKFRKVDLRVDSNYTYGLSRADLDSAIKLEKQMAERDQLIKETARVKNDLEAYILNMRDKIIDQLKPFISDDDRRKFEEVLNAAEDWLYSDEGYDTTKEAYSAKLESLKAFGNPVENRQWEAEHRTAAVSELQSVIERFRAFAASTDEAYDHITDDERQTVRDEVATIEAWLYDQLEAQAQRPQHEDPVVHVATIRAKAKRLQDVGNPIMNKPKPKPAPKEEPKPEAAPENANSDAKEGATEVPMEEDTKTNNEEQSQEVDMDEEIA